jgi:hypothetical protein
MPSQREKGFGSFLKLGRQMSIVEKMQDGIGCNLGRRKFGWGRVNADSLLGPCRLAR